MTLARTALKRSIIVSATLMGAAHVWCMPADCHAQSATSVPSSQLAREQPVQEIQVLMSAYHQAVISHDGKALLQLVLPEGSLWLNVLTDNAHKRALQTKPDTPKVRSSSFQKFAEYLTNSNDKLDPEHSDLYIQTDGTIGTVYFRFRFLQNGVVQNQGSETWQVVHTADGWKIAAIAYSSDPSPKP